ncbi:hypothetical protein N7445_006063 [Penicillium cf. griseofulvum]|nr:hypothetical protein N7445_006063 [Penicillium cf. griseofulvum]
MTQSPMLSCPLKQTNEIDWIQPLKDCIRLTHDEDPELYNQECATINRLRQDMRGIGKDNAIGRDLLYRYYHQLELLDLRFPADDKHLQMSFTWYDAFTHTSTTQFSRAYEKASILFNVAAILSCHAANQSRADDTGLKTAYHSFQAAAGMFTYINVNFVYPPSTDLQAHTVETLIHVTLAQAQEVFFEKQVADQRKPGLLAKLAGQAAHLYSQSAERMQNAVDKNVFDKSWTIVVQAKAAYMGSVASYYQAIADSESGSHGVAIARLQMADKQSAIAISWAKTFPSSPPANTNLTAESGASLLDLIKNNQANLQSLLTTMVKDNDFIYHQPVPNEAGLSPVARVTAAKAIQVNELYQGQDIERITGPDIFIKLVPQSVTEVVSRYSEAKAKLLREETQAAEDAKSLKFTRLYDLKLPGILDVWKGGMNQDMPVDEDFRRWCSELAGHSPFHRAFDELQERKAEVLSQLEQCSKQLDLEESVCEKMRSKYGADWSQQPSSRLNTTLRGEVRSYRDTINEASASDSQLSSTLRQYESDFDEMRSAGETDEADVLFQRALIKARSKHGKSKNGVTSPAEGALLDDVYDEGSVSVAEQIAKMEKILEDLDGVDRERSKTLSRLKDEIHGDKEDISHEVLLNQKLIVDRETEFFDEKLKKFKDVLARLATANAKSRSLMEDLERIHNNLRQDKRIQSENSKYKSMMRQRNSVLARYKKVYEAFHGLSSGIKQARTFYKDMGENVDSLRKNVETFISNRRSEGAQLLSQIERDRGMGENVDSARRNAELLNNRDKSSGASEQEDREREKLRQLMERLSTEPKSSSALPSTGSAKPPSKVKSPPPPVQTPAYGTTGPSPKPSPRYPPTIPSVPLSHSPAPYGQYVGSGPGTYPAQHFQQGAAAPLSEGYNPMAYPYQTPVSPPPNQQFFSQTPNPYGGYSNSGTPAPGAGPQPPHYMAPQGYIPPPPPPRPQQTAYPPTAGGIYPSGPGGYAQSRQYGHHKTPSQSQPPPQSQPSSSADPWAGLNAWK